MNMETHLKEGGELYVGFSGMLIICSSQIIKASWPQMGHRFRCRGKSRRWCGLILIILFQYLIEVANAEKTKMPANWNRVQSTKRVTRFHTPEARKAISERERYKETLDAG
jgi:hypothetical protein